MSISIHQHDDEKMKESLLDQYASLLNQGPIYDPTTGGETTTHDHDNHRPWSSNNHHTVKPSSANPYPLQMSLIPMRAIHTPMSMSNSAPSIPVLQRASTSPSRIHQSALLNVQGR